MTQPLWWDQGAQEGPDAASPASGPSSPPVPSRVDVAIVGGGLTGLWTAHYLLLADPSLDVVVLEAEHVGFGASGRNGGWVSALWPVGPEALARGRGRGAALAMLEELRNTVDEVGRATESAAIDCGFRKGGSLALARSDAQVARARAEVAHAQQWGTGTRWLDAAEASERLAASRVQGSSFTPHCALVHPSRLVD